MTDADWAKVADGLGGIGFTVQNNQEVEDVFDQIKQLQAQGNRKPIVVNAVIKNDDPIGTAYMPLDPQLYGQEAVDEYAKANHIDIEQQPSLGALLRAQGDNL